MECERVIVLDGFEKTGFDVIQNSMPVFMVVNICIVPKISEVISGPHHNQSSSKLLAACIKSIIVAGSIASWNIYEDWQSRVQLFKTERFPAIVNGIDVEISHCLRKAGVPLWIFIMTILLAGGCEFGKIGLSAEWF